jgi:hypothetical protein
LCAYIKKIEVTSVLNLNKEEKGKAEITIVSISVNNITESL